MSEPTPPPTPTPTPTPLPPTPPPPNLAPPPGYAAYQGTDFNQGGVRRVRGLAIAIMAVLSVFALASVLGLTTIAGVKDSSADYLAGQISPSDFDEELGAYGFAGLIALFLQLATAILTVIWLHRVVSNHRTLGRAIFWAPAWAIAGWFLPPFLFVIPLLVLIETWKASSPQVPLESSAWKQSAQPLLVWLWFAIFGVARLAGGFLTGSPFEQFSRDREDLAERFVDHSSGVAIQGLIEIASALTWGAVVWSLTQRHTELTGEATARR